MVVFPLVVDQASAAASPTTRHGSRVWLDLGVRQPSLARQGTLSAVDGNPPATGRNLEEKEKNSLAGCYG